ncbi:MAG: response regulator transcription factor [Planctomycetota bacterium]
MNHSFRILVVDNDPDILVGTARALTKAGYSVNTATNGVEALKTVQDRHPDLLLSDRDMPGMDGIELCRRIKQDPILKDTLVIIASGSFTESNEQSEGMESGADGYIVRPIANRELLARVESYVRIIGLTRSLRLQTEELMKSNAAIRRAEESHARLAMAVEQAAESIGNTIFHEKCATGVQIFLEENSAPPVVISTDVQKVLNAWPSLPEHIRSAIMALVGTVKS